MSVDIFFNKKINIEEVLFNTSLTLIKNVNSYFLCDSCGNAVHLYSFKEGDKTFDSFCIRRTNPYKILDELVGNFNVSFIDDDIFEGLLHINDSKKSDVDENYIDNIYLENMKNHGYLYIDGKYNIEERDENFYVNPNGCEPCKNSDEINVNDLPF